MTKTDQFPDLLVLVTDPDHDHVEDPEAHAVHPARTTTRATRARAQATSIASGRAPVVAVVAVAVDLHTRRTNQTNHRIELSIFLLLHLLVYKVIKYLNID